MSEYTILWPKDNIDPKKKDNNWLSQIGRAIFYRYENNKTYFGRQDIARLFEIRNYSEGRQSQQKYIDMWVARGDEKSNNSTPNAQAQRIRRKGYANINFEIFSMAPELKRIMHSVIGTQNQRIQCDCINTDIKNKKALEKAKLYVKSLLEPMLKEINQSQVESGEFVPSDEIELNAYETMGGFKQAIEINIEKVIEHSLNISDYNKIERQLKDDLVNFGFCVVKDYIDNESGATKVKYVDVTKFICAWTDQNQGDNTPFAGHFEKYNIPQVRNLLLANGWDEEDVEQQVNRIAKWAFDLTYSNDRYGWSWYCQRDTITDRMRYDDFFVDVLEFEYISKDTNFYKKKNRDGITTFYSDKFGEYVDSEKKKTVVVDTHTIYEGWFLPGANITVGGKQKNMKRVNKRKPQLSYRFEKVSGKSITETAIPIYDSLQINHLKLQAAKLAAAPKGIAIDIGALNINSIGGTMYTPFDLVQVYSHTGNFFYKSSLLGGKVNTNKTFEELEGGVGKQLSEWILAYQHDVEKLLQITGITPTMAGSPPKGDKLVGIAELEIDATNNALWPLQQALERVKVKISENIILQTMINIKFDSEVESYYSDVFGKTQVGYLKEISEFTLDELGLSITNKISNTQKFKIAEAAETALKVGRNGMPEIELSDYTMILDMLERGRLKEATWYLTYKSSKKKEQNDMMAMQNQQAQNQAVQEQLLMKQKGEMELMQMKAELEIKKEAALSNIRVKEKQMIIAAETQGNIEEIKAEAFLQKETGTEITGRVRKEE